MAIQARPRAQGQEPGTRAGGQGPGTKGAHQGLWGPKGPMGGPRGPISPRLPGYPRNLKVYLRLRLHCNLMER